jgi:hypothetical protein
MTKRYNTRHDSRSSILSLIPEHLATIGRGSSSAISSADNNPVRRHSLTRACIPRIPIGYPLFRTFGDLTEIVQMSRELGLFQAIIRLGNKECRSAHSPGLKGGVMVKCRQPAE